jgi:hypothetical protein
LRDVELTALLLGELRGHLAGVPAELRERRGPALPIFPTGTGGHHSDSNVRNRLLACAVKRANEKRAAEGEMLLPETVTPHTLRRTFASLALAAGRDPRWVMAQLGHTDARFTLNGVRPGDAAPTGGQGADLAVDAVPRRAGIRVVWDQDWDNEPRSRRDRRSGAASAVTRERRGRLA